MNEPALFCEEKLFDQAHQLVNMRNDDSYPITQLRENMPRYMRPNIRKGRSRNLDTVRALEIEQ